MKPRIKSNAGKQERPPDEAMTMVISLGEVGSGVRELVSDMKKVLSPYSFAKLKALRKNKLKDFVSASGLVGAKMLLLFRSHLDKTTAALARFPHGPTMHFEVSRFCTMSDVHKSDNDGTATFNKKEKADPFLVLSGFGENDEDQALAAMFQGMFPSILVGALNLNTMKRVVSISKENGVIKIRHYKVTKKDLQVNEGLDMILKGHIPDLSDYQSVDDFVFEKMKQSAGEKRQTAVRLHEIGPRIDMVLKQTETEVFGGMKIIDEESVKKEKKYHYRAPKREKRTNQ